MGAQPSHPPQSNHIIGKIKVDTPVQRPMLEEINKGSTHERVLSTGQAYVPQHVLQLTGWQHIFVCRENLHPCMEIGPRQSMWLEMPTFLVTMTRAKLSPIVGEHKTNTNGGVTTRQVHPIKMCTKPLAIPSQRLIDGVDEHQTTLLTYPVATRWDRGCGLTEMLTGSPGKKKKSVSKRRDSDPLVSRAAHLSSGIQPRRSAPTPGRG